MRKVYVILIAAFSLASLHTFAQDLADLDVYKRQKPGCKVLFQANSALFVEGTLNAISNDWQDSIIFRGVRLEQYYQDLPGQWFGIAFLRSNTCVAQGNFNHCVINESQYGIYAGGSAISSNATDFQGTEQMPVINIQKSIVSNAQYNAIYGFNANITAENSLFFTSGDYLVKLALGGVYNFTNCTMYLSLIHILSVHFYINLIKEIKIVFYVVQ